MYTLRLCIALDLLSHLYCIWDVYGLIICIWYTKSINNAVKLVTIIQSTMNLGGDNSSNSSEELCHSTLNSNSTFIRNVDFWGDGVFTFVCGLIGVIGNFMTIIIFRYFDNLKLGLFGFLEESNIQAHSSLVDYLLFSPSDISKKLSHHSLLHFPIGMGSYDHHAKY